MREVEDDRRVQNGDSGRARSLGSTEATVQRLKLNAVILFPEFDPCGVTEAAATAGETMPAEECTPEPAQPANCLEELGDYDRQRAQQALTTFVDLLADWETTPKRRPHRRTRPADTPVAGLSSPARQSNMALVHEPNGNGEVESGEIQEKRQ